MTELMDHLKGNYLKGRGGRGVTIFLGLMVWGGPRCFRQKFEEGPHLWALIF